MRKQALPRDWLWGAALTAVLFLALYRFGSFRFENSDDMLMVKPFMGFEGGVPASFTLYTHTLLAWCLYGLSLLWPGVAWFSVFQLALLFAGGTVIVKSFLQLGGGARFPRPFSLLICVLYLVVFAAFDLFRLNYTTTAALAGAAAAVQFMTAERSDGTGGGRMRAYLLSLLLLVGAYSLRAVSVLPPLAFIALTAVWRGLEAGRLPRRDDRRSVLRPMAIAFLIFALVFGALYGIRRAEIAARGLQPYLDWQDARIELMDYTDFQTDPAPALAADSGLSASEVEMVRQWYFMDENIDMQALRALAAAYAGTPAENAADRLWDFLTAYPRYGYVAAILMLLCGLCGLRSRKGARLGAAAALAAVAGAAVLLLYLCWRGRLIPRAADAVLLPCAAVICGWTLTGAAPLREKRWPLRRVGALALIVLLLVPTALYARTLWTELNRKPDAVSQQREADLETYALENPRLLIVRSPSLLRDTRLLPDVSGGLPQNITLWGDWGCRTPSWYLQLAALGFDGQAFTAADWLSDSIVLAATGEEDTQALCAYLTDALGAPVAAEAYAVCGTLVFYRFAVTE